MCLLGNSAKRKLTLLHICTPLSSDASLNCSQWMLLLLYSSLFKILFIALGAPGRKAVNPNKHGHPDFKGGEKRPVSSEAQTPTQAETLPLGAWPCPERGEVSSCQNHAACTVTETSYNCILSSSRLAVFCSIPRLEPPFLTRFLAEGGRQCIPPAACGLHLKGRGPGSPPSWLCSTVEGRGSAPTAVSLAPFCHRN